MTILKTSLRIVFLFILCIPIAYAEYYILKNTMNEVIKHSKKKLSKTISTNNAKKDYYRRDYLKIAK
ncbi:hypothetical protein [Maledivibacter halophilus]|uniref:Uncharacterized protein n=1 Tax=Maledivibacter halophilus TaxID=36842 RepID=A0A1T5M6C0_9FIRM|nr:hypothetical protein [Maledivibacter halophilus]SKC83767.1 hypothetical protein SAMN02194393_03991 [Maledivibacter halophilus]